jgi:hypothetical protein
MAARGAPTGCNAMQKPTRINLLQAVVSLGCLCVLLIRLDDYGASEFSGGWLTGRLFKMAEGSSVLFVGAVVLTFFYPRIAAAVLLAAIVLAAPFYLYVVMPGAYPAMFGGEYSVVPRGLFVWSSWAVIGLIALLGAAVVSIRILLQGTAKPAGVSGSMYS